MNEQHHKSFNLGVWLLSRLLNRRKNYGLFGDIEEMYNLQVEEKGRFKANLWFWGQILRTVPAYFRDAIYWNAVMFHNYFKVTVRNFKRQKAYSLINIVGLAVGMACCILILTYVRHELSYDQYHTNADRIYRLAINGELSGTDFNLASTNNPVGPYLADNFPEVEGAARIRPWNRTPVAYLDKQFNEPGIMWADMSLFDVFDFPLVAGDNNTALKNPYTAVITESTAKKYFAEKEPLGRVLRIDDQADYTITGVVKDVPLNSHFTFDILLSFATRHVIEQNTVERWMGDFNNFTYLLLAEGTEPRTLTAKFPPLVEEKIGRVLNIVGGRVEYILQPVTSIHLHSNLKGEMAGNSDIAYVYIFSAVALFILLLACINFMNLATARSANRAREVGMRKVHGAVKGRLVKQFLGEALIYSLFALLLSICLVEAIRPLFNSLSGRVLKIDYLGTPWLIPAFLGLAICVSLAAGSYPAFFLSGFQPALVLKGTLNRGRAKSRMRNLLVVFQFTVSIALIIWTAVILSQMTFMKNKKLGFDKERVIVVSITNDELQDRLPAIKQEFKMLPGVLDVSVSSHTPAWGARRNACVPEGFSMEESQMMAIINVDQDYLPTMGIELKEGRNFSPEFPGDPDRSVLINETAVKQFGWDDPIGRTIWELDDREIIKTVVGVFKDYHFISVRYAIEPMLITNEPLMLEAISLKIAPGDTRQVLATLQNTWDNLAPGMPFEYYFIDEEFNGLYQTEERLIQIFTYFSVLAIFIACLGLFGMAAFAAEQRTKEIGIRKILGASLWGLIMNLNREFLILAAVANAIAWPLVYLYARSWLQDFPYRTGINLGFFFAAAVLVFLIGLLTTSFQSIKAALANPIDSLRYE
jgi:putative ABC transport system permease protein